MAYYLCNERRDISTDDSQIPGGAGQLVDEVRPTGPPDDVMMGPDVIQCVSRTDGWWSFMWWRVSLALMHDVGLQELDDTVTVGAVFISIDCCGCQCPAGGVEGIASLGFEAGREPLHQGTCCKVSCM